LKIDTFLLCSAERDGNPFKFDDEFIGTLRQNMRQLVAKLSPRASELLGVIQNFNDAAVSKILNANVFAWPSQDLM
jgi:hypothetical protein